MPISPQHIFKNSGFSIVEIMVALVIGIMLTGFILSIFVNNKKSYDTNNRVIELNSNIRFALSVIQDDLENAGFYGGLTYKDSISVGSNFNNNGCQFPYTDKDPDPDEALLVTLSTATDYPVLGKQASSNPESGCLAGITAGTDYISIRGVRGSNTADAALDSNRVYIRAGKTTGEFFASGLGATITDAADMNWKYYSSVYYICQNRLLRHNLVYSSASAAWSLDVLVGPDLPEDNDGNPDCDTSDAEHTEAGIENMQILYGIDNGQDGVVDYYTDGGDIDSKGDWSKIIEVKISLLARSDLENSYTDTKTYLVGDESVEPKITGTYTLSEPSAYYHRSLLTNTSFVHNLWYGVVGDQSDL